MKKILTTTLILSGLAAVAFAQNNDAVAKRQEAMMVLGQSMKTLTPMAKGEAPFDQPAAMDALAKINAVAQEMPSLFPEDSKTGAGHDHDGKPKETEASPAIWENASEFGQLIDKFAKDTSAAVATNPQSDADVAAAMQMFASDCKACHEDFRIKKN